MISEKTNNPFSKVNNKHIYTLLIVIIISFIIIFTLRSIDSDSTEIIDEPSSEINQLMGSNETKQEEITNLEQSTNVKNQSNINQNSSSESTKNTSSINPIESSDQSIPSPPQSGSSNSGGGSQGNQGSSSSNHNSDCSSDESTDDDSEHPSKDCIVHLPSSMVTAQVVFDNDTAYFITDIQDIFGEFDIVNGSYLGWCIDYGHYANYSQKDVFLNSSYCPPDSYQIPMENWSALNFILNHKLQNATSWDIQTAVWYYVNIGSSPVQPTDIAWDIINMVNLSNGTEFIPSPGDIIAIIVDPVNRTITDQIIVIESIIPEDITADIHLDKQVDTPEAHVGDLITYTYTITNNGNTDLINITLTDDLLGEITLNTTYLTPGDYAIGTKSYRVMNSDLPGPIENIGIVQGYTDLGTPITDTDTASVNISTNPCIEIIKNANVTQAHLGDLIVYTYIVTNCGDVSLTITDVYDDTLGFIDLNTTILQQDEWAIGTASYVVTCDDIIAESLVNTVLVHAITADNITITDETSEEIFLDFQPNITLSKKVKDITHQSWVEQVTVVEESILLFNITIHNTGNETLYDIHVNDTLPSQLHYMGNASITPVLSDPQFISWIIPLLHPNESIHITYNTRAVKIGMGENFASLKVELCNSVLYKNDTVSITVLTCPSVVWVKYNWYNQSCVDQYNPSLVYQYNAFQSIQEGINGVCECGIVYVLNGPYGEQLFINKDLSLIGENTRTTFLHPGSQLQTITIPETQNPITPLVMAFGGEKVGTNIHGQKVISFSIEGFSFIGGNSQETTAIALRNIQIGCIDNRIVNNSIEQYNIGIQLWNSSFVDIDHVQIKDTGTGLSIDSLSNDVDVTHNWFLDNPIGILIVNNSIQKPSDLTIHYNYIDTFCSNDIGLWNQVPQYIVNATDNWWGDADGPKSMTEDLVYDAVTGRIAESVNGEIVKGAMRFDPFAGVGAVGLFSKINGTVNKPIVFDASQSWAFGGIIGPEDWNPFNLNYLLNRILIPIYDYKWDFGDGNQDYQMICTHRYTSPGNYTVCLRVRSGDIALERCDGHRPNEDGFIYGYAYYTLNIS